jgi:RHS repeat-associated protein
VAQIQDSYDTQGALIGTEVTYLHADHLGTPRIGTNASRQVTWRNRSDAFGIPELSDTAVVRLRFPGQLSLGVAGLNYNYFRDYDPQIGRYLESDPIGLKGGLNTYGYVEQNPLRYVDPTGEFLNLPGIAIGAGAETFLQLARNDWRWECLDVTEIAVAGAFGAFAPGLAPALRNVKAIRVLAEQLQRARAPSRIAKIAGRIGRHQSSALDTVSTVAGYQAVKWIGEQFWSEVERITPNTSEPDNCGETEPCK